MGLGALNQLQRREIDQMASPGRIGPDEPLGQMRMQCALHPGWVVGVPALDVVEGGGSDCGGIGGGLRVGRGRLSAEQDGAEHADGE